MIGRFKLHLTIVGILGVNVALALLPSFAHYPNLSIALHTVALVLIYYYCFHLSAPRQTALILISGVLLRLLFLGAPLSDDVNRYAWEGKIQSMGINPYITAPQSLHDQFADDPIYQGINHKDVSAIYPPVALLSFRTLASISYSLFTFKLFFILCDVLVLLLLPILLARWKVPPQRLAIYAWNPLILIFFSGSGHLDVMQILCIVIAFIAYTGNPKRSRAAAIAFFFLGTATMIKFLAVLLLPFMVTRKNIRQLPFFFLPFVALLPFLNMHMANGLITFAGNMSYNDLIPKLIRVVTPDEFYKVALLLVFGLGYAVIWIFNGDSRWRGMLIAWLWCLFCLPCVHIWYLAPLALLLIKSPCRPAWLFLITSAFAFHVYHYQLQTGEWREFFWVWLATYLPVLLLIIKDHNACRLPWLESFAPPTRLDVIVPTYNEGENIDNHLQSLQGAVSQLPSSCNCQIIVVDGGSTDDTRERVANYNCRLLSSQLGRGNQIAAGLKETQGDLTLILHADSTVNDQALKLLLDALTRKPTIGWGVLGHHYGSGKNRMSLIRLLNSLRFSLFAIAFGDQGMFFRRQLLEQQGGMPAMPLMEDVELSLRLSRFPRLRIGDLLTLSMRRWQRQSSAKHTLHVVSIFSIFLLTRRLGFDISQRLYDIYYKKRSAVQ